MIAYTVKKPVNLRTFALQILWATALFDGKRSDPLDKRPYPLDC